MKLAMLVCSVLLAGCAGVPNGMPRGVEMTSEEAVMCSSQRCTVWSDLELQQLVVLITQQAQQMCPKGI